MFRVKLVSKAIVIVGLFSGTVLFVAGCSSAEDRAQSHYERGLELVEKGEPIKAGLEFRNALKLNEGFVDALFQLGLVEEQQRHIDTAAKIYHSVAERSPEHLDVRLRLVYILLASGLPDGALKYAEQAMTIAQDNSNARLAMAAVELKLYHREEAVTLARSVLAEDSNNVDALMILATERIMASDPSGALAYLDQSPEDADQNIGLQLLRLSILDGLGNETEVEMLLRKLSQHFPDNPAIPLSLVRWYVEKGRNEEAEAAMRQFAGEHPDDDGIQLQLIGFLNSQDGIDAALAEARKIVAAREKSGGTAVDLRLAIAQLQFDAGDKTEAMDFMRSVIDAASDREDRNRARIQLARMAANQKDWSEAQRLADAVLDNDGKNVEALRVRASVRLVAGSIEKAIDDLLVAVNEAPNDVQLHSLLGGSYERKGMMVVAGEQYAKAMTLDQKSPATGLAYAQFLLRYGRTDQAANVLEGVRSSTPNDRQVLTLLAQLKLNGRDWVGAQQIAETLRQLDSDQENATADRIMAAALGGQEKLDESIRLLQTALSSNADRPGMLADLVGSYIKADRLADAEELLKKTLVDNASNVEAHILLGSVYSLSDRQDLARQAFMDAAEADKNGVLGAAALAQFHVSTGNLAEAENTVLAALKDDGNNSVLRSILGTIYQQQERFEDAIAQYELLFAANPESTAAANDLASLLSERRSGPEALSRAFEIAQRFQTSQVPQFLDTLGWIYYLQGDHPAALPLLKTAAEGLPQVALVQFHLGMVLKELGQKSAAASKLNEAIALTPPLIDHDLQMARDALVQLQQDASAPAATANETGKSQ